MRDFRQNTEDTINPRMQFSERTQSSFAPEEQRHIRAVKLSVCLYFD